MKNMGISLADAETTGKDPNSGKWRRIFYDCTHSFTALEDHNYCYKDICIDVTAGVSYEITCINCGWDCDLGGGNEETCEPEDCDC